MTEHNSFRQPSVLKVDIQLLELRNLVDWTKDCDNASLRKREISYYIMGKKQASSSAAASKAAKKAKATKKTERKETKLALKCKSTLKGSSTTNGKKSGKKKGNDSEDSTILDQPLARYLNDSWLFDTQEYKWNQVEFREMDAKPSLTWEFKMRDLGGYCKEYAKGKRPVGVMLDDTWLLKYALLPTSPPSVVMLTNVSTRITLPSTADTHPVSKPVNALPKVTSKAPNKQPQAQLTIKWERRKRASDAYAPSLRSGYTMTLWAGKGMGILFGGVTDEDTNEETLESVFWNDLYGSQLTGKGKWSSMTLKKPKAKGGAKSKGLKKKQKDKDAKRKEQNSGGEEDDGGEDEIMPFCHGIVVKTRKSQVQPPRAFPETPETATLDGPDPTDPSLTIPLPRYNAMLAVLRNTIYVSMNVDHANILWTIFTRFNWIKWTKSSSDDDDDNHSDDDNDEEEEEKRDGDNAGVDKHDDADEEEVVENAAENMEEDQSTTKIEQ
ncbi:hypothetical protein BYT27DRAFT_7206327, partial [Phlegmacium glaucopus]